MSGFLFRGQAQHIFIQINNRGADTNFCKADTNGSAHWEAGGMVLYSKLLEAGTFARPPHMDKEAISSCIEWRDLVLIVEGILKKPDNRRQRLETLKSYGNSPKKMPVDLSMSCFLPTFKY